MKDWIETDDGSFTIVNRHYNETYHSRSGAWAECQEVFLKPFLEQQGSQQEKSWRVLDVGFGLGFNWLSYVNSFLHKTSDARGKGDKLEIISLEHDAEILKIGSQRQSLGCYPVHDRGVELLNLLKCDQAIETDTIQASIMLGEARESLSQLAGQNKKFNVVLQDPFSPQKNPECWDVPFFRLVADCCELGGILVTYSVAREVRESLKAAGFEVNKVRGFGKKRERLVAVFRGA